MESLDPARINRIVLLIDLHPLLLPAPNPYIPQTLAAARRILAFPALSPSLAAFKFFFSSLPPILSTSKLHHLQIKSPSSLSFDTPLQTLAHLSQTLISLQPLNPVPSARSRSSLVAASMLQLEHDYAWDGEELTRAQLCRPMLRFRSNLVVLFSPMPESIKIFTYMPHPFQKFHWDPVFDRLDLVTDWAFFEVGPHRPVKSSVDKENYV